MRCYTIDMTGNDLKECETNDYNIVYTLIRKELF